MSGRAGGRHAVESDTGVEDPITWLRADLATLDPERRCDLPGT